ncbi:CAP domain-containing protein [Deinococcus sp. KSM4-11]|uniref:CAP domain-containing protein n=1 Tax=Deinococcus sp. KSM4-11 TaxID=2568654 RepID=UPI0010A4B2CF|nr:CAP domain-containing protein [Deinococcus sp. KSM4-11]THF88946.1 CAP domain-containing protein [Deinococcus sp. KSM4-11]
MQRSLSALFLLLLSACGTVTSPVPTVGAGRVTAATPSTAFAQRVFDLTNAARAEARQCGSTSYAATGPLTYNGKLEVSAQAHADDMAAQNYFSHTSLDGRTFDQRITATGYTWAVVAENIAAGQVTPEEVVQAWLNSEGHCADIMAPDLREIGIAYTAASSGKYSTYWVQDFGTSK